MLMVTPAVAVPSMALTVWPWNTRAGSGALGLEPDPLHAATGMHTVTTTIALIARSHGARPVRRKSRAIGAVAIAVHYLFEIFETISAGWPGESGLRSSLTARPHGARI